MKYCLLLLIVFAARADAADFRVLNIGDACVGLEAKEAALGSKAIPRNGTPNTVTNAFEAKEFGRDVVVLYLCNEGRLNTGNYRLPLEDLNDAVKSFRNVHDQLLRKYGTSFLDSSPWHVRDVTQPAIISSQPNEYYTEWRTPRLLAHLMIVQGRQPNGSIGGWTVSLFIVPPAPQLKPN
ncbi:MAG: hypothetical protein WA825_07875 [Steroidobacteraceae bacterium]